MEHALNKLISSLPMATTVTIKRYIRPLRLAFLVRPADGAAVLRVIETNTCIWGGRYNAIIPYHPSGIKVGSERWSCDDFVKGFVKRYEPDFLVDLTGEGKRFFDEDRVLTEHAVLDRAQRGRVRYGVSANAVYKHWYQEEYRFVRRHKEAIVLPRQALPGDMMLAATFGRFPADVSHFAENFREVFEPDEDEVTALTFYSKLLSGTPLKVGSAGLEPHTHGFREPAIFLLNGGRTSDIIDYWNLRALGWQLVPFPLNWADDLLGGAREFLHRQLAKYAGHGSFRTQTALLGARSVSEEVIANYTRLLEEGCPARVYAQPWYPRIWNERFDSWDVECCMLVGEQEEVERRVEGAPGRRTVALPALLPPVSKEYLFGMSVGWATVISMPSSVSSDEPIPIAASVIPTGLDDPATLFCGLRRRHVAVTREGLVMCSADRIAEFLRLPSPSEVATAWFKGKRYISTTSAAGRVALAIVRAIGGLFAAKNIAHPELLRKLNAMSHGVAEAAATEHNDSSRSKLLTRPRSEVASRVFAFLTKLNGNKERAATHLRGLLDADVFRVGLQLACPECTQTTWFALDSIRERLRCDRCLADFSFPAEKPPTAEAWAYRTQGAFSVESFAQGSYAVVLALRALALEFLGREWTWIPSTVLFDASQKSLEFDFAAWWREADTSEVSLLFGEAKTFGNFAKKDFETARALSKNFPGAYLVFVTLKTELSVVERRGLCALARKGRKPMADGKWRSPVVVITGREIFGDSGAPQCWKEFSQRFERAAEIYKPGGTLLSFAHATQYVYLGIEPDESLLHAAVARRRLEVLDAPPPRKFRSRR